MPPCVGVGACAELGPLCQFIIPADKRLRSDVTDLRQVCRSHELVLLAGDDIRQSISGQAWPEQFQQHIEVRRRKLVVGTVDTARGQSARAFAGMVFSHHSNNSAADQYRPPRHPFPRRRFSFWWLAGGRVVQVDGEGALTAIGRYGRVTDCLLEVSEHRALARVDGVVSELEKREAERLHR